MEQELYNRLIKVADRADHPGVYPDPLLRLTIATLEAIRGHIQEYHHEKCREEEALYSAIKVVKCYQ